MTGGCFFRISNTAFRLLLRAVTLSAVAILLALVAALPASCIPDAARRLSTR
jgi:hypothetical protein